MRVLRCIAGTACEGGLYCLGAFFQGRLGGADRYTTAADNEEWRVIDSRVRGKTAITHTLSPASGRALRRIHGQLRCRWIDQCYTLSTALLAIVQQVAILCAEIQRIKDKRRAQ